MTFWSFTLVLDDISDLFCVTEASLLLLLLRFSSHCSLVTRFIIFFKYPIKNKAFIKAMLNLLCKTFF